MPELAQLTLEDLLDVEVSLASRKSEKLTDTAAAVYVITQEEIRRSGLSSIPALLRLVPGIQDGRLNSNNWVISARGYNETFSNKLLVLIDGRTVYNPLFSGVLWDVQDVVIEDIDRIEVIRGPGAALWGANAVNGIVNVVTKSSWDTQGALTAVTFGGGEETSLTTGRYGGMLGKNGRFRIYMKGSTLDGSETSMYGDPQDRREQTNVGFRADWDSASRGKMTLQGNAVSSSASNLFIDSSLVSPYVGVSSRDISKRNDNMLFRWERPTPKGGSSSLQFYWDHLRNEYQGYYIDERSIWDLDYQRQVKLSTRHQLVWGMGYRYITDSLAGSGTWAFTPSSSTSSLYSAFAQDDIALVPSRLKLTLGAKYESDSYSGSALQPNVRVCYTPRSKETIWASVARAVRTPSRTERSVATDFGVFQLPDTTPVLVRMTGNPDFQSEELLAYEAGYRIQPTGKLSFDIATFYNIYSNLRSFEPQAAQLATTPFPHLEMPVVFDNLGSSIGQGAEVAANWLISDTWRIAATASWLDLRSRRDPTSQDTISWCIDHLAPTRQFSLRSYADLSSKLEFDVMAFWVGSSLAPQIINATPNIPAYTRVDLRLGWRPKHDLEVSFGVRNALDSGHLEGGTSMGEIAAEIGRSIYTKAEYRF